VTCDIEYDVTMQDGVMLDSVSLVVGIGLEMNCSSFELIPVCVANKNNDRTYGY